MKLITGLFRSARKKLSLTHDNDMGAFREKLNALVEQKDALGDEEINSKVEELKSIIEDLPENEDKAKLARFLEDFKSVKEQDANVAKEAAGQVADLFEKLDKDAMEDVPGNVGNETTDEDDEIENDEVKETVKETVAPNADDEVEETEDDEKAPTLEEIYEYIKMRMEEDAQSATEDEDATEEDADCVTDHAPKISVKITKDNAVKGGLLDLFNSVKGVN